MQLLPEALFGHGDELLGDLLAVRRADEDAEVDAPAHLVPHQLVEAAGQTRQAVVLKVCYSMVCDSWGGHCFKNTF